jgi:hypothetical protein
LGAERPPATQHLKLHATRARRLGVRELNAGDFKQGGKACAQDRPQRQGAETRRHICSFFLPRMVDTQRRSG